MKGISDISEVSQDFKDRLLEHMLTVRTDAVRDFHNSDAPKFLLETKYDLAHQHGFDAVVGQLQNKGLVPSDYDLDVEEVSSFNESDGSIFVSECVLDSDLFKSEFVELVFEETVTNN